MGGVFICLGLLVVGALVVLVAEYRQGRPHRWFLGMAIASFALVLAYLVVKLVYEEFVPCVFVDPRYCNFFSTQYWNLFGWEF